MLEFIGAVFMLVVSWKLFKKMGREGWEGIVPLYSAYVLFDILYGNGWRCLFLLIPFYNIYIACKLAIDLAHAFNKETAFGIGLIFLAPVFMAILAFDNNSVFRDGSLANNQADILDSISQRAVELGSDAVDKVKEATVKDNAAKLEKLKALYDQGALTEEEYNAKRAEIIAKM